MRRAAQRHAARLSRWGAGSAVAGEAQQGANAARGFAQEVSQTIEVPAAEGSARFWVCVFTVLSSKLHLNYLCGLYSLSLPFALFSCINLHMQACRPRRVSWGSTCSHACCMPSTCSCTLSRGVDPDQAFHRTLDQLLQVFPLELLS